MESEFTVFIDSLKETHFSLKDYVDFPKIEANVEAISIKLNQLNYLIGQSDMAAAVHRLWDENPKVFSVLGILIAVRSDGGKKAVDEKGIPRLITDYFNSPEDVVLFLDNTGLTEVLQSKKIRNLVDYVFGIEVGLDTNARKNRSGKIMENIVARRFEESGITFRREVKSKCFPELGDILGKDIKRFDFVVETLSTTYLIEVNFYSGSGSKPNEVARAYETIAPKVNAIGGYEFVWITDGIGWLPSRNILESALTTIPKVFNLTTLDEFIDEIKHHGQPATLL